MAATRYQTILERVGELGFPMYVASCFLGLAGVACAAGRPEAGARLFGAAEGIAAARAAPIYPRDRPVRDRVLATLTAALGQARLTAAREAGRALGLDEAMAEAQTVAEAARSATFEDERVEAAPEPSSRLSLRELEVLRLVAAGHTDREIADALLISRRTATTHLTHILDKLGLDSRTAAAAEAVRRGLV